MPAITINENGFVLDGPLVAGEPAAVSVSGLSLAAGASLSLTCTARFPDAILSSVALTQGDGGAWGGVLDTATKQAALYFLTARADEARAVVLELVDTANRDSLARVSAPMLNSSLLPKPDKAECASPLVVQPLPLPVSIASGGTGASTAAGARESLGINGNNIRTGGLAWDGAPIGLFADSITRDLGKMIYADAIAPAHDATVTYSRGDLCTYLSNLYRCVAQTSQGNFAPSDWVITSVAAELRGG